MENTTPLPQTTIVELGIKDRLILLAHLPQQGGIIKLRLIKSLRERLLPTTEEISAHKIRDGENGTVLFNPTAEQLIRIECTDEQVDILKEAMRTADERQVLTLDMLDLYETIDQL
ncbi:hypothetical protein [Spirosoma validum]|uniref:Uncharacterized protein n=1 Tax=Spirosoma validum TaxID=2771355 RepID=A0A927B1A9_9BACT|nr:hypothetical protein [Spirosoma validum]MBD2753740.1 hypothetical protein [Spirosoma validum]